MFSIYKRQKSVLDQEMEDSLKIRAELLKNSWNIRRFQKGFDFFVVFLPNLDDSVIIRTNFISELFVQLFLMFLIVFHFFLHLLPYILILFSIALELFNLLLIEGFKLIFHSFFIFLLLFLYFCFEFFFLLFLLLFLFHLFLLL